MYKTNLEGLGVAAPNWIPATNREQVTGTKDANGRTTCWIWSKNTGQEGATGPEKIGQWGWHVIDCADTPGAGEIVAGGGRSPVVSQRQQDIYAKAPVAVQRKASARAYNPYAGGNVFRWGDATPTLPGNQIRIPVGVDPRIASRLRGLRDDGFMSPILKGPIVGPSEFPNPGFSGLHAYFPEGEMIAERVPGREFGVSGLFEGDLFGIPSWLIWGFIGFGVAWWMYKK